MIVGCNLSATHQTSKIYYSLFYRLTIPTLLILALWSCKSSTQKTVTTNFERILQDTTNNHRAKWDLEQLEHYNNICKAINLNRLYDGVDSFEVRLWRQFSFFGMATDEEIYSLKKLDTTVRLTFYRVYCSQENYDNPNYRNWNPFTNPKIDSFFALSKSFPIKIIDSLNLQNLWTLKTQSALNIPDRIGFLDGSTTSIELASKSKYKLVRHHVAYAFYEKTKMIEIKKYIDEYDKLISFFQSNKIYDHSY